MDNDLIEDAVKVQAPSAKELQLAHRVLELEQQRDVLTVSFGS